MSWSILCCCFAASRGRCWPRIRSNPSLIRDQILWSKIATLSFVPNWTFLISSRIKSEDYYSSYTSFFVLQPLSTSTFMRTFFVYGDVSPWWWFEAVLAPCDGTCGASHLYPQQCYCSSSSGAPGTFRRFRPQTLRLSCFSNLTFWPWAWLSQKHAACSWRAGWCLVRVLLNDSGALGAQRLHRGGSESLATRLFIKFNPASRWSII